MALHTFHSTPVLQEFRSTLISRAGFFFCLCFLLCVFAPLLIAYSTHGFWIKHNVHREVPDVRFKYQAMLLARSPTSEITWSTSTEYNTLTNHYLLFPTVVTTEVDENGDGFMDSLDMKIEFEFNETVHFLQLLLTFSYQLKEISIVNMESLAIIQHDSTLPLSELHYVGDLQWVQRRMINFRQNDNRYNQTVMNTFETSDILKAYSRRDYVTEMRNEHYSPIYGSTTGLLRIHAYIRYTEAMVEYTPSLWYVLKWAWIQYASILVICIFIIGNIKHIVFTQQMIPTWTEKQIKAFR